VSENGVSREELKAIMVDVERRFGGIEGDLYNHGNGLLTRFNAFVTEFRTREDARERAQRAHEKEVKEALDHKSAEDTRRNNKIIRRLGIIGTILTTIGVLIAVLTFRELEKKSQTNVPQVMQPSVKSGQDASDPSIQ
jgi:hypothetical protein